MKKLYRSKNGAVFLGVLAGLSDYFKVDPNIIRVLFIFAVLLTGGVPGFFAYFAALLFMPFKDEVIHEHGKGL